MSAGSVLARGRAAAQALMVDTCTIRRKTGGSTDDLTGQTFPSYTTVYSGVCRVQTSGGGAMGARVETGEVAVIVLRVELQLPVVGSEAVRRGDEVSITTTTNTINDSDLLNRTFRVHDLFHKTHATSRRIQLEEAT